MWVCDPRVLRNSCIHRNRRKHKVFNIWSILERGDKNDANNSRHNGSFHSNLCIHDNLVYWYQINDSHDWWNTSNDNQCNLERVKT